MGLAQKEDKMTQYTFDTDGHWDLLPDFHNMMWNVNELILVLLHLCDMDKIDPKDIYLDIASGNIFKKEEIEPIAHILHFTDKMREFNQTLAQAIQEVYKEKN